MIPFINTALFGNNPSNTQTAVDAVRANELLGKNLATFFINTKIDRADLNTFAELYYEVKADQSRLAQMNSLLRYGQNRLEFGFDSTYPANPILCLYFKRSDGDRIRLTVPDLTVVLEEQMLQTSALSSLLAAKEKIMTALIDIGFFQKLSDSQQSLYREVLFLQP
jgi:hypothetical protein